MMTKFKVWLCEKFLPRWCRAELLERCSKLQAENDVLRRRAEQQEAYIAGLQAGLRAQRRIVINNHAATDNRAKEQMP